jgi:predicted nucleotidyltransferase
MRLAPNEHEMIRAAIHQQDALAAVYLFGSRADDRARGGDIDLLVLSQKINLLMKLDMTVRRLNYSAADNLVLLNISLSFATAV